MTILLLLCMALLEVGFGIYTIARHEERKVWLRNRCIVDGSELVIYLLSVVLPGIDFSSRFRFLLIVLVIRLLVTGVCCFCKYKKAVGKKRTIGVVCSVVGSILILFVSLVPAFVFADYKGRATTGEHSVAMGSAILVDQNREETFENDGSKREVPVHFYYPADAKEGETFPFVLFSHGAFGYYQSNTSTYMELASHGYVVVSLDHPYHSFYTKDSNGKTITVDMNFMNEVMGMNGEGTSEEEIIEKSKSWLAIREADINFVLDTLEAASVNHSSDLNQTFNQDTWCFNDTDAETVQSIISYADFDKIGLMGHSLGGAAAVGTGRERDDIDAVIDLDGTMLSEELAYKDGEYIFNEEPYPIPLLSIDNESHHTDGLQAGSYYVNNEILDKAIDGQHTYFVGSAHMNFTDLPLFSPVLASMLGTGSIDAEHCIDQMNEIVLDYMDTYLKDAGEFHVEASYQ